MVNSIDPDQTAPSFLSESLVYEILEYLLYWDFSSYLCENVLWVLIKCTSQNCDNINKLIGQ